MIKYMLVRVIKAAINEKFDAIYQSFSLKVKLALLDSILSIYSFLIVSN